MSWADTEARRQWRAAAAAGRRFGRGILESVAAEHGVGVHRMVGPEQSGPITAARAEVIRIGRRHGLTVSTLAAVLMMSRKSVKAHVRRIEAA